jgi:predicted Zn-dependent peptidase
LIQDLFMEGFWKGHSLGRPISGTKKSVAQISRGDVLRYFRENYTARNTLITVAGNVSHRQVDDLVARHFSGMKPGTKVDPGIPPRAQPSHLVRHKKNLEQTHLCLGAPCPPMNAGERYCTHVLNNVLGGGMSSRLFQNIREKRGLVYTIYSTPNLYQDAGNLLVYAGAAPEQAPAVIELTLKELRKIRAQVIPADELKRAKENLMGSVLLSLESTGSRMTNLAQQLIYFGRFYSLEEIVRGFDRVRAKDVRELANEVFDPKSLALTALTSKNGRALESIDIRA